MNTFEQYKQIFADAFEVEIDSVEKLQYMDNGWDSVGHMLLVSMLEESYNIELDTEDIIALDSFEEGIRILSKYGISISR